MKKKKKDPQILSEIWPYRDQFNWKVEKTNFPTTSKDWQKFETNNRTIVLNVLFLPSNGRLEKIRQAYI